MWTTRGDVSQRLNKPTLSLHRFITITDDVLTCTKYSLIWKRHSGCVLTASPRARLSVWLFTLHFKRGCCCGFYLLSVWTIYWYTVSWTEAGYRDRFCMSLYREMIINILWKTPIIAILIKFRWTVPPWSQLPSRTDEDVTCSAPSCWRKYGGSWSQNSRLHLKADLQWKPEN